MATSPRGSRMGTHPRRFRRTQGRSKEDGFSFGRAFMIPFFRRKGSISVAAGCFPKILRCRFVTPERVTPPLTAQSLPSSSSSHQEIEPVFLHFQLEMTPDGERTLASASSHFSFSQAQQASNIKLIWSRSSSRRLSAAARSDTTHTPVRTHTRTA